MKLKDRINAFQNKPNDLHVSYALLVDLPKSFRDLMSDQCGWSEATFYRKTKVAKPFSAAEKDKLIEVLSSCGSKINALCRDIENSSPARSDLS